jgi:hypothetical protein
MTKMQNARKLEDWLEIWRFGASFHLNETKRFGQNDAVPCILKKKQRERDETVPF